MTPLRLVLLAAAGCLTALCLMVLVGPGAAGPVLVDGFGHGVHLGDLPALLAWLVGVGACGWGWWRCSADARP